MRKTLFLVLLVVGALWGAAMPTHAQKQETQWFERPTTHFRILYTAGHEPTVETYAAFVDAIYDDVATIFSHRPETPLTLRLYPTQESYSTINPLAPSLPGIVAHADFRHREVVVILSETQSQTPEEVENNVRHELTHIIAAELSGNRLNTGFQEGIAQYMEENTPDSSAIRTKIELLSRAVQEGNIVSWSDFENRDMIYGNPQISYPQTLSAVAFLIERHGFGMFRDFIAISERSSGYRSALERAYGVPSTELEAAWREWIPSFIEGGYRHSTLASYDLSYAHQLLQQGRYQEAKTELEQAIVWLQENEQPKMTPETLQAIIAEAQSLLARSQKGAEANRLAQETRLAIERGEYDVAVQYLQQARALYQELGDTRQQNVLQTYAMWIERGGQAMARLEEAEHLARTLRLPQSREASKQAAMEFAALGDATHQQEAVSLLKSAGDQQWIAGIVLTLVGIMGVAASAWGHWKIPEQEVW
jgi:tetratricopeptide (TPR) repeat protein